MSTVPILTASTAAFGVGFVGDAFLNYLTRQDWFADVGLRNYFLQHGNVEALFIAAGLMFASMWLCIAMWPRSTDDRWFLHYLVLFGAILDIAFRFCRIMPSLDDMYSQLHPITSIGWASGPLLVSFLAAKYYVSRY